jgi:hypothetical protein
MALRCSLADGIRLAFVYNGITNLVIKLHCDGNMVGVLQYDHRQVINLLHEIEEKSGPVFTVTVFV